MASDKLTIYIACCVNKPAYATKQLATDLQTYMTNVLVDVRLQQRWTKIPYSNLQQMIRYVKVSDHDGPYLVYDGRRLPIPSARLHVDVFYLSEDKNRKDYIDLRLDAQPYVSKPVATVINLPSEFVDKKWARLHFEDYLQYRILRCLLCGVSTTAFPSDKGIHSNQTQTVLLHGPPGTGKTSLCEALAQQMSIRLSSRYPTSKLIRVEATAFFSRNFPKSNKAVTKFFSCIETRLKKDESCFIYVLIDEIETLAKWSGNGKPTNTVNALRQALNMLHQYPHVLIMFTTKLIDAVDTAFLDRISTIEYIGLPGSITRYEILRAQYVMLARRGVVFLQHITEDDEDEWVLVGDSQPSPLDMNTMLPYYRDLACASGKPGPSQILYAHAQDCEGVSGRRLASMPFKAICMFAETETCTIGEALEALRREIIRSVKSEQAAKALLQSVSH